MRPQPLSLLVRLTFLLALGVTLSTYPANISILPTDLKVGSQHIYQPGSKDLLPLADFIHQVTNGVAGRVTGIYSSGIFAMPVVQQLDGNSDFISTVPDTITQFKPASNFGSLGFVAHNTLAGSLFPNIRESDTLVIVYGDGSYQSFRVSQIRRFKAVTPDSPYSDFIDLTHGVLLTYEELFYQTYGISGQVVLQTCIAAEGNGSWGRLFIIAIPQQPVIYNPVINNPK